MDDKKDRKGRTKSAMGRPAFVENLRGLIDSRWDSKNLFIKDFNNTEPREITLHSGQLSEYINYKKPDDGRMPHISIIEKLADYFDVTVDYLLGRGPKTRDVSAQAAGEYLGINADILKRYHESPVYGLVTSSTLGFLIDNLCDDIDDLSKHNDIADPEEYEELALQSDGSILGSIQSYLFLDFFNEIKGREFNLLDKSILETMSDSRVDDLLLGDSFAVDGKGNVITLSSQIIESYYLNTVIDRLKFFSRKRAQLYKKRNSGIFLSVF